MLLSRRSLLASSLTLFRVKNTHLSQSTSRVPCMVVAFAGLEARVLRYLPPLAPLAPLLGDKFSRPPSHNDPSVPKFPPKNQYHPLCLLSIFEALTGRNEMERARTKNATSRPNAIKEPLAMYPIKMLHTLGGTVIALARTERNPRDYAHCV